MKIAVVGATGLVGSKMIRVLSERNFPVTELIPVASERSVGKEVEFKGKKYKVVGMEAGIAAKPAIAIFSAGGATSFEWAPKFAAAGITVIDNSSAWRMDPDHRPLILAGGPKAIYEPYDLFALGADGRAGADAVITGEEFILLQLLQRVTAARGAGENMLTAFRRARDTTRMERTSSYSAGNPRSKNGITNSSVPRVKTNPRKISLAPPALSSVAGMR